MKSLSVIIILICLSISCQSSSEKVGQSDIDEKLIINYTGDGDVVQFKMFEGIDQVLKKNPATGIFEGVLGIPNLNEAIFTYDIIVHKKDSLGQMTELEPNVTLIQLNQNRAIKKGDQFLWDGKRKSDNYLENKELVGSLKTITVTSHFLNEEREITIYTPGEINSETPHIYFTDGFIVNKYAPFVDYLISANKIRPIKMIGVHSSSSNRYEEYIKGNDGNELFKKHQAFFYREVIEIFEKEIDDWKGKRYLFGFSNGAAFCMHEGINNPNDFIEVIAFSTADYISSISRWFNPIKFTYDEYPPFYMRAGRYEESIFKDNINFVEIMRENGIKVDFKGLSCGHDYNVWRIEFLEYLEKRFKE